MTPFSKSHLLVFQEPTGDRSKEEPSMVLVWFEGSHQLAIDLASQLQQTSTCGGYRQTDPLQQMQQLNFKDSLGPSSDNLPSSLMETRGFQLANMHTPNEHSTPIDPCIGWDLGHVPCITTNSIRGMQLALGGCLFDWQ